MGRENAMWAVLTTRDDWDADTFFASGREEIDRVLGYVDGLGVDVARGSALDFGCGVGRLTRALSAHFTTATGVDIAPAMIEQANELNADMSGCRFVLNGEPHLQVFPDRSFDFIYSNIVLQHMDPALAKGYLREFVRLLTDRGLLVVQLASHPSGAGQSRQPLKRAVRRARELLRPLRRRLSPRMEMHGVARDDVIATLTSAGARVIDIVSDDQAGYHWVGFRYAATKT
jgi:ubiquinone/menaquinone biosynthesis C-methylase UbiE